MDDEPTPPSHEQRIAEERILVNLLLKAVESGSEQSFLDAVLGQCLQYGNGVLASASGAIFLSGTCNNRTVLKRAASYNLQTPADGPYDEVAFGECDCGKSAQEKSIVLGNTDKRCPLLSKGPDKERAHISIPLIQGAQSRGVLLLDSPPDHNWASHEIHFLRRVAETINMGLQRHTSERRLAEAIQASQQTISGRKLLRPPSMDCLQPASRDDDKPSTMERPHRQITPDQETADRTILYMEPNANNRILVERIIGKVTGHPYRLNFANDPETCIEMANRQQPDLIMINFDPPHTRRHIRMLDHEDLLTMTRTIPVVALCSRHMLEDIQQLHLTRVHEYITMPLHGPTLTSTLDKLLADKTQH